MQHQVVAKLIAEVLAHGMHPLQLLPVHQVRIMEAVPRPR